MITLEALYRLAEEQNIPVDRFPLQKREALSVMDTDGSCAIALDPGKLRGEQDERNKLCHELGHCCTGAFYNRYAKYDTRLRHENRADKWALLRLLPVEELDEAIATGCTEFWQLAERFGLPEAMIKKAVCYYVHGNLAAELYF